MTYILKPTTYQTHEKQIKDDKTQEKTVIERNITNQNTHSQVLPVLGRGTNLHLIPQHRDTGTFGESLRPGHSAGKQGSKSTSKSEQKAGVELRGSGQKRYLT